MLTSAILRKYFKFLVEILNFLFFLILLSYFYGKPSKVPRLTQNRRDVDINISIWIRHEIQVLEARSALGIQNKVLPERHNDND